MIEIQWRMRRILRRLGMAGLSGLLLLLLALAIFLAGVVPIQHGVEVLRKQLAARPVQSLLIAPVLSPEQALAADLGVFQQRFFTVEKLSDQLDTLFKLTDEHELTVNKGEYALNERAGGALRRFEVTLPVSGTYPHIRQFILHVLDKLPAMALADVALEREKIVDGRVKATLRFVIFVRKHA